MIRFDVFGRLIGVERIGGEWQAYHLEGEGKRRRAPGVIIPTFVEEDDLAQYLADLCHERARPETPDVRRLPE